MDEQRPGPELGTPEAAVQSAVNLLAKATGINESRLAYYLDMYYQLRNTYEAAKAREQAREELLNMYTVSPLYPEPLRPMSKPEASETDEPLSVTSVSTGDSSPRRGSQERKDSPTTPSTAEAVPLPQSPQAAGGGEEDEALRAKRLRALEAARKAAATVDRKGEKNPNAMAAAEKRRIRERFIEARQKGGAPTAELVKACPTLTEGDVWRIVNGHSVGIEIYRLLESTLDQIENSITKDDD